MLSTHLVAELARTCTHVIVVAGGRIRLDGTVQELGAVPAELERVVLGELAWATDDGPVTA